MIFHLKKNIQTTFRLIFKFFHLTDGATHRVVRKHTTDDSINNSVKKYAYTLFSFYSFLYLFFLPFFLSIFSFLSFFLSL